jgi:hypothetical protein
MKTERSILKFGWYSSLAVVLITIITWGFAMIAIPPVGPYCPGDCMEYPFTDLLSYYPRDYYWMYLAIFQVFAYLLFMISIHFIAPVELRVFGFSSVAFSIISAMILLCAYFIQFSVVPISMMKGESEGIALLTQYNEHGIFIAMEELAYICMSISFLFMGFVFSTETRLEKAIRLIFLAAFPLIILAFSIYTAKFGIDRSYRFEVAAISVNWLVTISTGILICIYIKKSLKAMNVTNA